MSDDAGSVVQRCRDAYADAVWRKDVDALVAIYDTRVRVFDLWERWSYEGIAAWRGVIANWFASIGAEERVRVTFDDVRTIESPTLVVATGAIRYESVQPDGTIPRWMENRFTWSLAVAQGRATIVHEHTSAPISGETSKPILRR
jgi:ketosteroid isomerase-like protein